MLMDFSVFDDEALQRMAARGDRAAEEALITRHLKLVRICSRPFFLAGGDSEDLLQEGTVGLLDAVRQYDPSRSASFQTFAQWCIRNRMLNAIKSASRQKHAPLNDYVPLESSHFDESHSLSIGTARDPEELLIARERLSEIQDHANPFLSALEHRVLDLFLQGLTCGEIAALLERPLKSVENAVQRIRKKLSTAK